MQRFIEYSCKVVAILDLHLSKLNSPENFKCRFLQKKKRNLNLSRNFGNETSGRRQDTTSCISCIKYVTVNINHILKTSKCIQKTNSQCRAGRRKDTGSQCERWLPRNSVWTETAQIQLTKNRLYICLLFQSQILILIIIFSSLYLHFL